MRWAIGLIALLVVGAATTTDLVADFQSSFLVDGRKFSTLSYLSDDRDDNWRSKVRTLILANGDTHVDILARNTDKPWGMVTDVGSNWNERLGGLRDNGLAPVIWLRGDDSPEIDALPISDQLDYNDRVVKSVDSQVSHYVACLECDEYYSVPELNVVIQRLRKATNKPIAVHLTPGMRGKEGYIKNADVIYLQTGFDLTEAQFRSEIEYALTLGKPVVVSEYHMDSDSAEAKSLGDIACGYSGVVGTGNGRGSTVCGSMVAAVEKEKWHEEYDDELAVFMLAVVSLSAAYGLKMNLPFTANFNYVRDDQYEVMFAAPVSDNTTVGATVRDNGRIMLFGRWSFDRLKFKTPEDVGTNERR